ncbi:uncharacterized protein LOC119735167 [Patiria miniata]|uniref:Reverse transcriptase/retrotransposon-derived protein RNase H-like domain-containing protein n=1 Tax=Patiria miniata TaxID=46514 RepID=A0A914ALC4_PATMI|nr:uncharacterized protein LOC119735167 [Patiria miniata]
MAHLHPHPPFLNSPGTPPLPWKQWRGLFETYIIASGAEKYSDERKRALLLQCLGPEGQRNFGTLPTTTSATNSPSSSADGTAPTQPTYADTYARLQAHFQPTVNVVAERYRFRQRAQRTDEPVEQYVIALRQLAVTCDFGSLADEMIRDQLVEKTCSSRIRERLLLEPKLTLSSALTLSQQMESAFRESKSISNSAASFDSSQASNISILPLVTFDKYFLREALLPPRAKLTTYSHQPIAIKGCFRTSVCLGDSHHVPAEFYVAESGDPILGLDIIRSLSLTLKQDKVVHVPVHKVSSAPATTPEPTATATPTPTPTATATPATTPAPTSKPSAHTEQHAQYIRASFPDLLKGKVGLARGFIHRVKTRPDVTPTQQRLRRLPFAVRDRVKAELQRLESEHIIERIDASEWVSPIIVSYKKSGAIRLCVDLRQVNQAVVIDKFTLPDIQELFSKLRGATIVTRQNVHDQNLTAVLQRLQDIGLRLNTNKCQFNVASLRFLGHVVSGNGLQPDPSHVEAILHAPCPTDVITLRSFLGLASYYARFVPNYSTVIEPLHALTRKDVQFSWTPDVQHSFHTVKELIANCVTLRLFDPDLPVIVSTDAFAYGLGAVKGNSESPIAFASRTLTAAERNYSVGEKEALAY